MRDALWVAPLAVFVAVGTFFAGGGHDGFTPWEWVSVGLAVAACLSLLLGRRAPGLGVLLPGLLAGVYLACGFADGPVYLPFLLGAFVTARRVPVRRWLPWFAASVATLVVGMAVRAATTGLGWWQPLGQSIGVTALAVAAATVGSLLRARRQEEAERVARAATEEQLRMAQDLHDGVGHGLAVIAMQAGVALHVLDRDPDAARRSLEAIRDTSTEALDALRAELSTLAGSGPGSGSGVRVGAADAAARARRPGRAGRARPRHRVGGGRAAVGAGGAARGGRGGVRDRAGGAHQRPAARGGPARGRRHRRGGGTAAHRHRRRPRAVAARGRSGGGHGPAGDARTRRGAGRPVLGRAR